jgi:hypothetical protein
VVQVHVILPEISQNAIEGTRNIREFGEQRDSMNLDRDRETVRLRALEI